MVMNSRDLVAHAVMFRKAAKLTQWQVAERIGTSQSAVSDIETGRTIAPQVDTFLKYLEACGALMTVIITSRDATVLITEVTP